MALTVTNVDIGSEISKEENHLFLDNYNEKSKKENFIFNEDVREDLELVKKWWGDKKLGWFGFFGGMLMMFIYRILQTVFVSCFFYF